MKEITVVQDENNGDILFKDGIGAVILTKELIKRGVKEGLYSSPAEVIGATLGIVSTDNFKVGDSLAMALGIVLRKNEAM